MTLRRLVLPLLLAGAVGLAAGCGDDDESPSAAVAAPQTQTAATAATVQTVTPDQIAERVTRGEVLLVDVREQQEWDAGRAAKAVHVPLGEVASRLGEIHKRAGGRPVVFICRSGNRSAQAAQIAVDGGLQDVLHVGGGMGAWASAGLPLVPADGRVL